MREVKVGDDHKVLLIREKDQFRAVSYKCIHMGAPLKDGSLSHGRIRCPWHGACFNTTTGDIEDSPGLDCLETFPVIDLIFSFF